MKILSFIGMLVSIVLMIVFSFLCILLDANTPVAGILLTTVGMIGSAFMMIFCLLVAKNYKWGNKNFSTPLT